MAVRDDGGHVIPLLVVGPNGRQKASLSEYGRTMVTEPSEYGVAFPKVMVNSSVQNIEIRTGREIAAPIARLQTGCASIGLRVKVGLQIL
jgi:hypothetical protein